MFFEGLVQFYSTLYQSGFGFVGGYFFIFDLTGGFFFPTAHYLFSFLLFRTIQIISANEIVSYTQSQGEMKSNGTKTSETELNITFKSGYALVCTSIFFLADTICLFPSTASGQPLFLNDS